MSDYLNKINCKLILVERKYVDRDFLTDFSNYYVRCSTDYDRFCRRLHFFKDITFEKKEFMSILCGKEAKISRATLEIIDKLSQGFPIHEYAITINEAKEILGENIVFSFTDHQKYLNIWDAMRKWLRLYVMEESTHHIVRYIIPSKERK